MPVTFTTDLPKPTGVSSYWNGSELIAEWDDVSNYGEYIVEYSVDGGSSWTTAATVDESVSSTTMENTKLGAHSIRVTSSTEHSSTTSGITVSETTLLTASTATSVVNAIGTAIESTTLSTTATTATISGTGIASGTLIPIEGQSETHIIYLPPIPRMGIDATETDAKVHHGENFD